MKKSYFNIDNEKPYLGYTNGETWNGWECPYFTKQEADKIISYCVENEIKAYFDISRDTYYIETSDVLEAYKGHDIVYNNKTLHVYGIGSCVWCWTKVE
ncbi:MULTISPECIES: hypothetical protein [unclassified Clostridium]|uniref:hypothetical protein n=1 Tax=unclassified Clostridium TaxID=2614128 RepID=UPI0025BD1385|nr:MULTISPECIES: hypothetical protein [unclassified Clostridium]